MFDTVLLPSNVVLPPLPDIVPLATWAEEDRAVILASKWVSTEELSAAIKASKWLSAEAE